MESHIADEMAIVYERDLAILRQSNAELLAALENLLTATEWPYSQSMPQAKDQARAAIAKARGE